MKPIQLFDPESHSYSYLLFDEASREALFIDPVDGQLERDLTVLHQYDLKLLWTLYTGSPGERAASQRLARHTGANTAVPAGSGADAAARKLKHGDTVTVGSEAVQALDTPGPSGHSMSYLWRDHVFTGDTLLINGCGRTDHPAGSAEALYRSLTDVLFALPADTLVWPGHDQDGHSYSTIGLEKAGNESIAGRTLDEFVAHQQSSRPQAGHGAGASATAGPSGPAQNAQLQPAEGYAGNVSPQLAYQWAQSGEAVMVDVRTAAEREWVGFVPQAVALPWKNWPGMALNPDFEAGIRAVVPPGKKAVLLCRSGVRSVAAARKASELGIEAYSILEGFEGDADAEGRRGNKGGWRFHGLPWRQG